MSIVLKRLVTRYGWIPALLVVAMLAACVAATRHSATSPTGTPEPTLPHQQVVDIQATRDMNHFDCVYHVANKSVTGVRGNGDQMVWNFSSDGYSKYANPPTDQDEPGDCYTNSADNITYYNFVANDGEHHITITGESVHDPIQ